MAQIWINGKPVVVADIDELLRLVEYADQTPGEPAPVIQAHDLERPTPPTITRPRRPWTEPLPADPEIDRPAPPHAGRCKECGSDRHDGRYHAAQRRQAGRAAARAASEVTPPPPPPEKPDLVLRPLVPPPVDKGVAQPKPISEPKRQPAKPKAAPAPLSWLKPAARPALEPAPPEADGRIRICPTHEIRLSIARTMPNGRPVYMCSLGHETTNSLLREPAGA